MLYICIIKCDETDKRILNHLLYIYNIEKLRFAKNYEIIRSLCLFFPHSRSLANMFTYLNSCTIHLPEHHKCCNERVRICVRALYVSLINYYLKIVATANVSVYYTGIVTVVNCSRL